MRSLTSRRQTTRHSSGASLGPYRIVGLLGSGGMGEVYRAHDTTLGRDVAIKILPAVFTTDPDRRARFDREARVLAALNHPHIAAIYGVEETGWLHARSSWSWSKVRRSPTGSPRGALPLEEALSIARQIAEALEAAHEKGIVHRDLKPANIKITPQGVGQGAGLRPREGHGDWAPVRCRRSLRLPRSAAHAPGMILGTAAYMSPEQARGKPVDKRDRHLGVRLRALRDADRTPGLPR